VTLTADRRLLGRFDADAGRWRIDEGTYVVALGRASDALELTAETTLKGALFGR
jgi:beta-glucosidase